MKYFPEPPQDWLIFGEFELCPYECSGTIDEEEDY